MTVMLINAPSISAPIPGFWRRHAFRAAYVTSTVVVTALWRLRSDLFTLSCRQCKNLSLLGIVVKYPTSLTITSVGLAVAILATGLLFLELYRDIKLISRKVSKVSLVG